MTDSIISHTETNRLLPIIDIKTMDDEAIKALIADGYKLLDQRKRERERQVKDAIKQMAIDAGIKVSFREPVERKKRANKNDPAHAGKEGHAKA